MIVNRYLGITGLLPGTGRYYDKARTLYKQHLVLVIPRQFRPIFIFCEVITQKVTLGGGTFLVALFFGLVHCYPPHSLIAKMLSIGSTTYNRFKKPHFSVLSIRLGFY